MSYPSPHEIAEDRKARHGCLGCVAVIVIAVIMFVWMLLFAFNPSAHAAEITGAEVFKQVNAERVAKHEPALVPNAALVAAAQLKANDMAKNHYFAHRSLKGWNLWDFIMAVKGKGFSIAGENLAEGFTTTETLTSAWMQSPTHRANILYKPFRKTGIGIAHDGDLVIVAQYFGD